MADEKFTIEDEWTDSAENEPDDAKDWQAIQDKADLWWARMLNQEGDEQC